VLRDGTIVNFTRSLPAGGYHVYKQDPVTLARKQIAFVRWERGRVGSSDGRANRWMEYT
jgi:hypothetical protein